MEKKEITFIDYLIIIAKWKKVILGTTIFVFILAVIFSLLLTKYYRASVLFLPPSQSSGLSSLIENFSIDILGNEEITGDVCLSILNSRDLREEIINKYGLMKLYKQKHLEHTLKELSKKVIINTELQVGIGSSNIISIAIYVIDKSPNRAANMANDFLAFLEKRLIKLNTQKASNNRIFLENRVQQNQSDLAAAEDSMKAFQKKYGAIEITAQAQAAIETAAKVKVELIKAKTTRDALLTHLSKNHSEVVSLQSQIEALSKEYNRLHEGEKVLATKRDILFPLNDIPDIGLRYYRLLREVEIQNKLQEMLIPLFEQAKIQEAKTVPILKVIDRAIPPTYKFKPKRAIIVVGIVFVYLSFLILFIFFKEYLERIETNNTEQSMKISRLIESIKFKL